MFARLASMSTRQVVKAAAVAAGAGASIGAVAALAPATAFADVRCQFVSIALSYDSDTCDSYTGSTNPGPDTRTSPPASPAGAVRRGIQAPDAERTTEGVSTPYIASAPPMFSRLP